MLFAIFDSTFWFFIILALIVTGLGKIGTMGGGKTASSIFRIWVNRR